MRNMQLRLTFLINWINWRINNIKTDQQNYDNPATYFAQTTISTFRQKDNYPLRMYPLNVYANAVLTQQNGARFILFIRKWDN